MASWYYLLTDFRDYGLNVHINIYINFMFMDIIHKHVTTGLITVANYKPVALTWCGTSSFKPLLAVVSEINPLRLH